MVRYGTLRYGTLICYIHITLHYLTFCLPFIITLPHGNVIMGWVRGGEAGQCSVLYSLMGGGVGHTHITEKKQKKRRKKKFSGNTLKFRVP